MKKKVIKVLERPATYIIVDADMDENEARANWLRKRQSLNRTISDEQQRRERETIRGGRVIQRKSYKK